MTVKKFETLGYSKSTIDRIKRLVDFFGPAEIVMAPPDRGGILPTIGAKEAIKRYLYFKSGTVIDWLITDVKDGKVFYIIK